MASGNLLNCFVPQFCHLQNGDTSSSIHLTVTWASAMCHSLFQVLGVNSDQDDKNSYPLIVKIKWNYDYKWCSLGHREGLIHYHSHSLKLFKYLFPAYNTFSLLVQVELHSHNSGLSCWHKLKVSSVVGRMEINTPIVYSSTFFAPSWRV